MQASNEKLASEVTDMKSDMKKRDSEYNKMRYDMNEIKKILNQMLSQKHNYLSYNMDSLKSQYPCKGSTIGRWKLYKNGVMQTLKHEISSPNFY